MIDPLNTTTVRVGQLPTSPFELTDKLPHEIGDTLFQGTVQQLADVIGDYLGTTDSLAFNPTTVADGGTLPATTSNEWMLVGLGTFHNVGGGSDIITTEELNAVTSNGSYWSLSVQIPINVELAGITQNIRTGYTETTPSEDALFNKFALYTPTSSMPSPLSVVSYPFTRLTVAQQDFTIPTGKTAIWATVNGAFWYLDAPELTAEPNTFTQSTTTIHFKTIRPIGNLIIIFIQ